MTIEEVSDWLYRIRSNAEVFMSEAQNAKAKEAVETAIKALEQQPCEDCISRQAVINAIANTCFWISAGDWNELMDCINSLSSVTPQPKVGGG